jgi:hypothetical protein
MEAAVIAEQIERNGFIIINWVVVVRQSVVAGQDINGFSKENLTGIHNLMAPRAAIPS